MTSWSISIGFSMYGVHILVEELGKFKFQFIKDKDISALRHYSTLVYASNMICPFY